MGRESPLPYPSPDLGSIRAPDDPSDDAPEGRSWDATEHFLESFRGTPFFEEAQPDKSEPAKLRGRPLISRDTPIQGGAYYSGFEGGLDELIVVDEKYGTLLRAYDQLQTRLAEKFKPKNHQTISKVYEKLQRTMGAAPKIKEEADFLVAEEVWKLVMEWLPYDEEKVGKIMARSWPIKRYKKIALDDYIDARAGVCRHQAVFAGWLLEKMIHQGKLSGQVSVDRNYARGLGGHAWTRYTNPRGQVIILDPALPYFGYLNQMAEVVRSFYQRPTDKTTK